ncbi:15817_t:CDS:2, partial [Acaulospora morrowiae]
LIVKKMLKTDNSNVQIALRIRSLSAEDLVSVPPKLQKNILSTTPFAPNQVVVQGDKKKTFSFDSVFPPEVTQKEVYDRSVMNLINKFIEGYNVTIVAYGHSSSGKSHTLGISNGLSNTRESKGIIPRAMSTLISYINSAQYKKRKYVMRVSFVEIHGEKIVDLLGEDDDKVKPQIVIRDDSNGQILWSDLQEIKVNSLQEAIGTLSRGMLNRKVSLSKTNGRSPHRHTIFTVTLSQQKFIPIDGDLSNLRNLSPNITLSAPNRQATGALETSKMYEGNWVTVTCKLNFVDLSWRDMDVDIPKSMILPIDHMIRGLGMPKAADTLQLTDNDHNFPSILKEYLGGNASVLVISCVSPAAFQVNETIETLELTSQAYNNKYLISIHQEVGWQNVEHLQDLVLKLKSEVDTLKENEDTNKDAEVKPSSPITEKQRRRSSILASILSNDSTSLPNEKGLITISEKNILQDAKPTNEDPEDLTTYLQKGLGPVIKEYEKSLSALENQLSHTRAALAHSENTVRLQEDKLQEAEKINNQNKHVIDDFKNKISKLKEREDTTESYIKDLETKLESERELHKMKGQESTNKSNDTSGRVKSSDSTNSISQANSIDKKLEQNENKVASMSKSLKELRKQLEEKDHEYRKLEKKFEVQRNNDAKEKKGLVEEIEMRDAIISELENKVENLAKESQPGTKPSSTSEDKSKSKDRDVATNAELLQTIEELRRKLAKSEEDNIQNQSLIDTLEFTLSESEENLNKQLVALRNREDELVKQIKSLKSQ